MCYYVSEGCDQTGGVPLLVSFCAKRASVRDADGDKYDILDWTRPCHLRLHVEEN